MVIWGDMGRFNLEFLSQNLFISSLAVDPIGATLKRRENGVVTEKKKFAAAPMCAFLSTNKQAQNSLSVQDTVLGFGETDTLTSQRPKDKKKTKKTKQV